MMSFVKFLLIQHFFDILILNTCCSDPYNIYSFLKKHDVIFQMDINTLLYYI